MQKWFKKAKITEGKLSFCNYYIISIVHKCENVKNVISIVKVLKMPQKMLNITIYFIAVKIYPFMIHIQIGSKVFDYPSTENDYQFNTQTSWRVLKYFEFQIKWINPLSFPLYNSIFSLKCFVIVPFCDWHLFGLNQSLGLTPNTNQFLQKTRMDVVIFFVLSLHNFVIDVSETWKIFDFASNNFYFQPNNEQYTRSICASRIFC